jgi:hypothetical protein
MHSFSLIELSSDGCDKCIGFPLLGLTAIQMLQMPFSFIRLVLSWLTEENGNMSFVRIMSIVSIK